MLEPNFSPFTEIKTERLLLRCLIKSDAPTLLFLRSDETVMQYIDREKPKTLDEAEGFVYWKRLKKMRVLCGLFA